MTSSEDREVAIIGAGVGGLMMAIALQRELGLTDYIIYEKQDDLGGTWKSNTYPGCTSDVSIHLFSLSTDPKTDWPNVYGFQPDILAYWKDLATKHDIRRRISFNTLLVSAIWNEKAHNYTLVTQDLSTGQTRTSTCKILVCATGFLEQVHYPEDIQGRDSFQGAQWHSGEWNHEVELKGRKVVVIGNAASATQFMPIISRDPSVQITQLARTPHWYLPSAQADIGSAWRWAFKWIPGLRQSYRSVIHIIADIFYHTAWAGKTLQPVLKWVLERYIRFQAPEKYADMLIPKYMVGCKRVLYNTGYFKALHQSNVELRFDKVVRIEADRVVLEDGETIPCDVIIYATGFTADDFFLDIRGRTQTVKQYYDAAAGPKAYLGTLVPGFPNLFLLSGPNTVTGHTSIIQFEEIQTNLILQLIRPIVETKRLSSVDVIHEATDKYNTKIHKRLDNSVVTDCVSWYRHGGTGKVTSLFPGTGTLFWWWLRKPVWGDYLVTLGENADTAGRKDL